MLTKGTYFIIKYYLGIMYVNTAKDFRFFLLQFPIKGRMPSKLCLLGIYYEKVIINTLKMSLLFYLYLMYVVYKTKMDKKCFAREDSFN